MARIPVVAGQPQIVVASAADQKTITGQSGTITYSNTSTSGTLTNGTPVTIDRDTTVSVASGRGYVFVADVYGVPDAITEASLPSSVVTDTEGFDDYEPYEVPSIPASGGTTFSRRRAPLADKIAYDIREFFPSSSTPSDIGGYIEDGWTRLSAAGGRSLLVPEGYFETGDTIVPPAGMWLVGVGTHGSTVERLGPLTVGRGATSYQLPDVTTAAQYGGGESWIALKSSSNVPLLAPDGTTGPFSRGATAQYGGVQGVVLDHNGRNQSGVTAAVNLVDLMGFIARDVRLVSPYAIGWRVANSNDCSALDLVILGDAAWSTVGTGTRSTTTTLTSVTGTWYKGDLIAATGVADGSYVSNVSGSTLTIAHPTNADPVTVGGAVDITRYTPVANHLLALVDGTVDCMIHRYSGHAAATSSVLLDSVVSNEVRGFAGYIIGTGSNPGGANLIVRDTWTSSDNYLDGCRDNFVDLRCDQSTWHNARISGAKTRNNQILIRGSSPGKFSRTADSDGGWSGVYLDAPENNVVGEINVGYNHPCTVRSLVHLGSDASDAVAKPNHVNVTGGRGIANGTQKYTAASQAVAESNIVTGLPAPMVFGPPAFAAHEGTPAIVGAGTSDTNIPALAFDGTSAEAASVVFAVPAGCNRLDFRADWISLDGTAGAISYVMQLIDYADGETIAGNEASTSTLTLTMGADNVVKCGAVMTLSAAVTPGKRVIARVRRTPADAGDTIAADVGLVALNVIARPTCVAS